MKKAMLRFTALLLAAILMLTAVGCSKKAEKPTAEELEKMYGVSYDKIICEYSFGCAWDDPPYKRFSTYITIYADRTVRIWTLPSKIAAGDALAEYKTVLTEAQTQNLINAFREYNMFDIDNSVDEGILDGWSSSFSFYNSDGEEVYSCWGSDFTPGYSKVEDLLQTYFPLNGSVINRLEKESEAKMSVLLGKDNVRDDLKGTGETLNIYCWNQQFQGVFDRYYVVPEGIKVNWIVNPSEDECHYNRVNEALSEQYKASPDDRIDIFLVDAKYLSRYIESDDVLALDSIYCSPSETMYQYMIDSGTDSEGKLKGVNLFGCPGTLIYRRSIAREVLGTDDPAQVQERLDSWEKFEEVAKLASDKGYYMTASFADTVYPFNHCSGLVSIDENNTLRYDPDLQEWIDMTKTMFDNNSTLELGVWDTDEQKSADGKTMCFFGPTWYYRFCMGPAWETCPEDWAICQGPQAYANGDIWLLVAANTDNPVACRDIIEFFTTDYDTCVEIIDANCIPNNSQIVKQYSESSDYEAFIKGQNEYAILDEIAQNISSADEVYAYDYALNTAFTEYLIPYFKGKQTLEKAMDNFEKYVYAEYPEVIIND